MRIIGALLLVGLAAPAAAQSLLPEPAAPGRYEMQPIEGGVARLDTLTGEVSLCRLESGTLRCRPGEDSDEPASRTPNVRSDRGADEGDDDGDDVAAAPRHDEKRDDAEFDKAITRMKQLFRAFGDVARDWEHDDRHDGHGADDDMRGPERT